MGEKAAAAVLKDAIDVGDGINNQILLVVNPGTLVLYGDLSRASMGFWSVWKPEDEELVSARRSPTTADGGERDEVRIEIALPDRLWSGFEIIVQTQ